MNNVFQNKIIKTIFWIIVAVLMVRLVSLGFNPMMDTTEARYSEIGRIMFETGNWITPQFDYGVPFWGKPPLSFWATAASFHIFGVSDFAAHLPHFLFMLGIVVLMYFFVRKYLGQMAAMISAAVMMTLPVFVYLMGGVMTDPAFALCVTLAFISFYNAMNDGGRRAQGYLFFAAVGLALLAKGPLAFVIIGAPIFLFVLFKNKWRELRRAIPWIGGPLLMLVIALPWYILAERATPGFLDYFIIGEHYLRYVTPHWTGDLYGQGRGGFPGKIICFWIISLLPWLVWIAAKLFDGSFRRNLDAREFIRNDFLFFMVLNIAVTLLFFSLSKNIVMTYVITTIAPSAVLIAWMTDKTKSFGTGKFKLLACLNIALFAIMIGASAFNPKWSANIGRSDRFLVRTYIAERHDAAVPLFYFLRSRTYSSRFYSDGKIIQTNDVADIRAAVDAHGAVYALMPNNAKPKEYGFKDLNKTIVYSGKKNTLVKLSR
ncbi:MAG: glycosyltransferase family 39 protein [Rickettsiales bacterium]|jgi:4-amino-4-deoxy-L-arabinose transferase-like glycosyltransferase|nr:glycosyltransferase family 39 protein [Rickettsiales bacterium]